MISHSTHCFPCEMCELKYMKRIVGNLELKIFGTISTSARVNNLIIQDENCQDDVSNQASVLQIAMDSLDDLNSYQHGDLDPTLQMRKDCMLTDTDESGLNINEETVDIG